MTKRLGIGMVGSGFNAKFHLLGFVGVRDADVLGVWSPNQNNAAETAGIACEKPLARNVTEATRVLELVNKVGLPHGYLENQVFAPQVEVGRDLLWARGAKLTG